jgi:hypothetical protein
MRSKGKTQQKAQVPVKVSTPRKCLEASINEGVCANSECTKNSVQADDVIEGNDPKESIDPAGRDEIMEGVHAAETIIRSGKCKRGRAAKAITSVVSSCQTADKRTPVS